MSLSNARQFLEKVTAAEAAKRPEDRLLEALSRYMDIELARVAPLLGISAEAAQRTVANLRAENKVAVFKTGDRFSVRRTTPAA